MMKKKYRRIRDKLEKIERKKRVKIETEKNGDMKKRDEK